MVLNSRTPLPPQQPPRTRSSKPAADPEGFFKIVEQALGIHQDSLQVPISSRPFYTHSFPKDKLTAVDKPFEGFTFELLSSVPAARSNDGSTSRRPTRFSSPDPERAGYTLQTAMWPELITVEFTCWSKSNPRRGELTTWFHRFMLRYANHVKFFEGHGIDLLEFVGRGRDSHESKESQDVYFGTLTYQARIQFIDQFTERNLDQVTVHLQASADNQSKQ